MFSRKRARREANNKCRFCRSARLFTGLVLLVLILQSLQLKEWCGANLTLPDLLAIVVGLTFCVVLAARIWQHRRSSRGRFKHSGFQVLQDGDDQMPPGGLGRRTRIR